jgi:hypothetical protein
MKKKIPEQIAGTYSGIPHKVLDCVAFTGASYRAKALLFDLIRQLNGTNNGHLQLSTSWLKKERGWMSADLAQKAKQELIDRRLVVKTRFGGLNNGPDLWAVTWLIVSNCAGLDLRADQLIPGAWHFFIETEKQKKRSVKRNSTAPTSGMAHMPTVPLDGTKTVSFPASAVPVVGNNVNTNVLSFGSAKRIVGKSGASGKKATTPQSTQMPSERQIIKCVRAAFATPHFQAMN